MDLREIVVVGAGEAGARAVVALREQGWDTSAATFSELMARYGRSIPQESQDSMPPTLYVSAQRRKG